MSKLIDLFEQASTTTSQPMGFRSSNATTTVQRMVLVTEAQDGATAESIAAADAVIITPQKTKLNGKDVQTMASTLQDKPWGMADSAVRTGAKPPAGCDFIVLSALSPVNALPEDDDIAKIMQLEASMDDGIIRSVNDLPIDAVIVTDSLDNEGSLNWHQLMILRHLTHLISVPVIVPVPATVTGAELKVLCEAGVNGVMLSAEATAAGKAADVKDLISKLPPKSTPKKKRKSDALAPRIGYRGMEAEVPDEDDDWE